MSLAAAAGTAGESALRAGLPVYVADAVDGIDPERIRTHVKFLADDLLEGRGTGTRGGDIAAQYIAAQFALDGLKPAGDAGGYLQKVAFNGVQTLPESTASVRGARGDSYSLRLGDDFVVGNQQQTETIDVEAPIVFIGYGIDAPEYGWNDFKGVDVRGKVVLVIVNEPPSKDPKFFNGDALTYYGRWTYKFEQAARAGAVAALIIHRTDLASYGWDVVRSSWSSEEVYLANDKDPKLKAAAWIHLDAARRLLAGAHLDVDRLITAAGKRGFKAQELPLRFSAHIVSRIRNFESYNVLGILPGGREPAQALMYSAHYDHLGIDPNLQGHQIYNGAVDNATGCGVLLELARVYAGMSDRLTHPVLFAAVTAEEKGLLGSDYLGKHLPIAAANIAVDLNFDAILPIGVPESITVAGAERTSFYPTLQKTAATFSLGVEPDPQPGAGHFYRSDHFSLARAGVPAFSINAGTKYVGHPLEWGKAQVEDYTASRYHRPSDEYLPAMDFSGIAALTKFGFVLGWEALLAPHTIQWLPGDEFEAARLSR